MKETRADKGFELVICTGANRGKRWPISTDPIVLGRSSGCDIVIMDGVVSRRHCEIWRERDGIHLRDLDSSNASFVNGQPVEAAILNVGDEVTIGGYTFVVAQAGATNELLSSSDDAPTPRTVSLAESRFILDETPSETRTLGQPRDKDDYRDLFALSRRFSRTSTTLDLIAALQTHVHEKFDPAHFWLVTYLRDDDLVFHLPSGQRMQGEAPIDALLRAGRERMGLLIPQTHVSGKRTRLTTTMVAPLDVANESFGAMAASVSMPDGVYDESALEYFIALAHTFAPFFRALERFQQLQRDAEPTPAGGDPASVLVGASAAMHAIRAQIVKAAQTRLNILLLGESGVGKEIAARLIHELSPRADGPYVVVNCAALPATLTEAELFGHEKGAFTGAERRRIGKFEEAHGGTLFLDEIGDLPPQGQAAILRAIEGGTFDRLGGPLIGVDVRVIAATNRPDANERGHGGIREDLFHRLAGFTLKLPPLRERLEDIAELARHFIRLQAMTTPTHVADISLEALKTLRGWHWPGNVRELRACIERATAIAQGSAIEADDIVLQPAAHEECVADTVHLTLAEAEKRHIARVLKYHDGSIRATARTLNIARSTLYIKLREYGLE